MNTAQISSKAEEVLRRLGATSARRDVLRILSRLFGGEPLRRIPGAPVAEDVAVYVVMLTTLDYHREGGSFRCAPRPDIARELAALAD